MSDNLLDDAQGKPRCIALVLCSEVIEDKRTNNSTLVSLFNTIVVAQLPTLHPRMFVFASFAQGVGEWPLTVAVYSPSGKEIIRLAGVLEFADALNTLDVILEFRGLPLLELGPYRVDISVKDTVIMERIFTVQILEGGVA